MKQIFALLSVVALLTSVGCGPGVTTVSGTVTLDGEPMEGLIVAFTPDGGGPSGAGTTDAQGKYTLNSNLGAGIPSGSYKVSITSLPQVDEGAMSSDEGGDVQMDDYNGGSDSADYAANAAGDNDDYSQVSKETIPAKYNANSTLKEEVGEGDVTIDFALTSD